MGTKLAFSDVFRELTFGTKLKPRERETKRPLSLRVLPEEAEVPKKKAKKPKVVDTNGEIRLLSDSIIPAGQTVEPPVRPRDKKAEREAKIRQIRKLNRIFVWGDAIPAPFIEFDDLELPKQLGRNLKAAEFAEPTPIQMQSIPVLLQKRNLLATAPTGSGKTLAFLLPIVKLFAEKKRKKAGGLFAIVVAPTNVLASQIHVQALKFCDGMRAEVGLLEAGTECNPNANILVCTPNRLIYAMKEGQMTEQMLSTVEWLVVDEADRLFDKTEKDRNFRIQLEEIYRECHGAEKKVACRSAFFSATFSHELELWAREVIKDLAMVCIGPRNSSNSNVTQSLVYSGDESGKVLALVDLLHTGFEPPAIVFVQSKERAGALLVELQDRCPKIPIRLMSSELSAEAREKILTDFRTGKVWCLIATEMLARGLDLSVNLVVNFDVPTSIVSYVHRIGRTGRAGRSGRSITFFSFGDLAVIRPIATVIHQAGFEVPQYTLQLSKVNKDQHAWLKTQQPNREAIGSIGRWRRVKKAAMKSGAIKRDPKLLGKKKRKAKKAAEAPEIQEKPKEKKTKPKKKSKAKADE